MFGISALAQRVIYSEELPVIPNLLTQQRIHTTDLCEIENYFNSFLRHIFLPLLKSK
jgi:hypothetical protein